MLVQAKQGKRSYIYLCSQHAIMPEEQDNQMGRKIILVSRAYLFVLSSLSLLSAASLDVAVVVFVGDFVLLSHASATMGISS